MGNDPSHPYAPGNVCLGSTFHEGGIYNLESLPAARYVFLFRKDNAVEFNLSSARAFQAPNLLEQPNVSIIADYPLEKTKYGKDNLITNFSIRNPRAS